jgi:predicted transcriptional regulator
MASTDLEKEVPYAQLGRILVCELGQRPQWWLAQQLFVTQAAVSQWICGVSRPRPEKLGQLAALLGQDVNELAKLAGYDQNSRTLNDVRFSHDHWCRIYQQH